MDDSWGGERTPESRRYSSSVRMVLRERLIPALSPIVRNASRSSGLANWTGAVVKLHAGCMRDQKARATSL